MVVLVPLLNITGEVGGQELNQKRMQELGDKEVGNCNKILHL